MDKLRAMETFIAVVECGSFTDAAARLEMSAVMVGRYIALIERQLNTRLLERNTRRQSLTDAGRVYFDEAKRVLEQVSIAESAVERLRIAPAGTLRVSAPTSFGACVIAPLTATFLQAWPDVRVELDLTNRMVDLVDEGFDLAIRIGEIRNSDLVAKYLAPYRMTICAAPGYLARYGTPTTPADWPITSVCRIRCGPRAMSGSCLAPRRASAGSAMPSCAAMTAMPCERRRSPGPDWCCSRKSCWPMRWRAVNWCACWRRIPRSRGRFTCSGGRICGRCRS